MSKLKQKSLIRRAGEDSPVRSISFGLPMLKALRAGRKCQTRRTIKPQPPATAVSAAMVTHCDTAAFYADDYVGASPVVAEIRCRYGIAGTVLLVKEPVYRGVGGFVTYSSDDVQPLGEDGNRITWPWKPMRLGAMYMPHRLARTSIKVKSIRPERLHEISEADAESEGLERDTESCDHKRQTCADVGCFGKTHKSSFVSLWAEINGWPSWESNPWVWVVSFTIVTPPEAGK